MSWKWSWRTSGWVSRERLATGWRRPRTAGTSPHRSYWTAMDESAAFAVRAGSRRPTSAEPTAVHLITLGCARNEVDSEELAAQLDSGGFRLVADPLEADAVMVNTCGFIEAAKKDSIDTLLAAADLKSAGRGEGGGGRRMPCGALRSRTRRVAPRGGCRPWFRRLRRYCRPTSNDPRRRTPSGSSAT